MDNPYLSKRDLYGGFAQPAGITDIISPEPSEQQALANETQQAPATTDVNRKPIILWLIGAGVVIVLLGGLDFFKKAAE